MTGSRRIAFCAVITAIIAVVAWMPWVFLVPVLVVSICFDWKMSLFASAAFGFISLFYALIMPVSNVALLMTTPATFWIPIVARLPIGVIAHFAYKGFSVLFKTRFGNVASVSIASVFGTLVNTLLFVPLVALCATQELRDAGTVEAFMIEFPISAAIEATVALLLVPAIIFALKKSERFMRISDLRDKRNSQSIN